HFGQHVAIDLDAGGLHARQHRRQRQVDFVVNAAQALGVNVGAEGTGQTEGKVGALGERAAEGEVVTAQDDGGERVRGVSRIEQVTVKERVVLDAGQFEAEVGEGAKGGFEVMDRLRRL